MIKVEDNLGDVTGFPLFYNPRISKFYIIVGDPPGREYVVVPTRGRKGTKGTNGENGTNSESGINGIGMDNKYITYNNINFEFVAPITATYRASYSAQIQYESVVPIPLMFFIDQLGSTVSSYIDLIYVDSNNIEYIINSSSSFTEGHDPLTTINLISQNQIYLLAGDKLRAKYRPSNGQSIDVTLISFKIDIIWRE